MTALLGTYFSSGIMGIFGADFVAAAPQLSLLLWGQAVATSLGLSEVLLLMTRHEKLVRNVYLAGFAVSVSACLLLIPTRGADGAVIALLASTSAIALVNSYLVFSLFGKSQR